MCIRDRYNAIMKAAKSLRKMASRLKDVGTITENAKQSYYNFANILARIANQRNPSTKEELYALLDSYNGLMVKTQYVIAKIEENSPYSL